MTASLPAEVQAVFDRFITTEYTTVDRRGQPITWPVTPYYSPGGPCIDVTTGLGYPKKADDARANPKVALLFSDPTGSGLERPPMVLVQGTAQVDDRDLEGNRDRYERESNAKLPGIQGRHPPRFVRGWFSWYYTRIYVHVRPERVYAWPGGDVTAEPALFDAHLEEVRSGHVEEPEEPHARPTGDRAAWDDQRLGQLGTRFETAVVAVVSPDGFPFAFRVPVRGDAAGRRVHLEAEPVGVPLEPGRACLTAHEHDERFSFQRNFQVRGDLVRDEAGWSLVPHRLVGGFELPESQVDAYRANLRKALRFRRTAKRELARRGGGG